MYACLSDLSKFMDVTRVVKKVLHADLIRTTLSREREEDSYTVFSFSPSLSLDPSSFL